MLKTPGSNSVNVVWSLLQGDACLTGEQVVVGPICCGRAERIVIVASKSWILMVMLHMMRHELLLVQHDLMLIPAFLDVFVKVVVERCRRLLLGVQHRVLLHELVRRRLLLHRLILLHEVGRLRLEDVARVRLHEPGRVLEHRSTLAVFQLDSRDVDVRRRLVDLLRRRYGRAFSGRKSRKGRGAPALACH